MLRFFTNRELSHNLLVPLAKWKRWAREFLPPDPLGGLQSGVARQYSVDQSLVVYIGGHLVSELKTTIPEARQIMTDLHSCFKDIGAFTNLGIAEEYRLGEYGSITTYSIIFGRNVNDSNNTISFSYVLRGMIRRKEFKVGPHKLFREEYLAAQLLPAQEALDIYNPNIRILPISAIVNHFAIALKIDRKHFRILEYYNPDF